MTVQDNEQQGDSSPSGSLLRLTRFGPGCDPYILSPRPDHPNWLSILDEFSQSVYATAANLWPIAPDTNPIDYDHIAPELLFAESVWNGNRGTWRYMFAATQDTPKPALSRALASVHDAQIPCVFWNKEDPVHFDEFIGAAKEFDYVFTTDSGTIDDYRRILGHDRVAALPFCANPAIHNPRRVESYRAGDIAFAGQYFAHKFPARKQQMDCLFPAAQRHRFAIFSRALGGDKNYQFPERYAGNIVGSLPYTDMVVEYRRHKIFLNVNSVVGSQTMCARRVYELTAAKSVVVTMPSPAISNVFSDDEVLVVDSTADAERAFDRVLGDDVYRRRLTQRAWRKTMLHHTARDRVDLVRHTVCGVTNASPRLAVIVVVVGAVGDNVRALEDELCAQTFITSSLCDRLVVVTDRPSPNLDRAGYTWSTSLAAAVDDNPTAAIAVMDARVSYGKNYLLDLAINLEKVVAEPACQKAHYRLLAGEPGDEECHDTCLVPRYGMVRAAALDKDAIGSLATDCDTAHPIPGGVYVSDPFNAVPRGTDINGWEV